MSKIALLFEYQGGETVLDGSMYEKIHGEDGFAVG